MRFYVRHWYSINVVLIPVLGVVLWVNWETLEVVQKLVLLNLMALFVHQFEEYAFPGGEPMIMNYVLQGSDTPDRFPLNQFSAMFTNVVTGIVLYGLPVFFPQAIWLSLAAMLFNVGQLIIHGVTTNRKMKSIYNPGLGAVVFLHLPLTAYFIWYVSVNGLVSGLDWILAILYTVACAVLCLALVTYVVFANRETTWVFSPEELERFHVRAKLERRGIVIHTVADEDMTGLPGAMRKLQRILHDHD